MRRLTFLLVWCIVLMLPWEEMGFLSEEASVSKLLGYAALGCAVIAVLMRMSIRPIPRPLWVGAAFCAWNAASMVWTIDPASTQSRVVTYASVWLFAWMIWEFADTLKRQLWLFQAYMLGCCISSYSLFQSVLHGSGPTGLTYVRHTGGGMNQNDTAYMLVLFIPVAAYFATTTHLKGKLFRRVYWCLVPMAAVGTLLTGSRGGAMALGVAAILMIAAALRAGWLFRILLLLGLIVGAYLVPLLVPARLLERVSEGTSARTFDARKDHWVRGFDTWRYQPIHGYGAATFPVAAYRGGTGRDVSHNAFIDVLVENGLVGLMLYASMVAMMLLAPLRMPHSERMLWFTLLIVWLMGSNASSWQYTKRSWFLLAMVIAQAAALGGVQIQAVRQALTRQPAGKKPPRQVKGLGLPGAIPSTDLPPRPA